MSNHLCNGDPEKAPGCAEPGRLLAALRNVIDCPLYSAGALQYLAAFLRVSSEKLIISAKLR